MNTKDAILSQQAVDALLAEIEPAGRCLAIRSIGAEFANGSFLIEAITRGGRPFRLVIKRYVDQGSGAASKARLE